MARSSLAVHYDIRTVNPAGQCDQQAWTAWGADKHLDPDRGCADDRQAPSRRAVGGARILVAPAQNLMLASADGGSRWQVIRAYALAA